MLASIADGGNLVIDDAVVASINTGCVIIDNDSIINHCHTCHSVDNYRLGISVDVFRVIDHENDNDNADDDVIDKGNKEYGLRDCTNEDQKVQ